MYKLFIKPFLDFIFALSALIILSPFLLILIIILIFVNKGKPFFIQERTGKDGQIFRLIKFRTMIDKVNKYGAPLSDNKRITRVGKFMRLFSIDELPQLVNVLTGKMSFVGPRPLLKKYLALYNSSQAKRHKVVPGITGWAQVNGRNMISWTQKFQYDVWYVDNLTFLLDMKIIFTTIFKVLRQQGINSSAQFTMEAFNGCN